MQNKTKEILDNKQIYIKYDYSIFQILMIACGITRSPRKITLMDIESNQPIEIIRDKSILKELP